MLAHIGYDFIGLKHLQTGFYLDHINLVFLHKEQCLLVIRNILLQFF